MSKWLKLAPVAMRIKFRPMTSPLGSESVGNDLSDRRIVKPFIIYIFSRSTFYDNASFDDRRTLMSTVLLSKTKKERGQRCEWKRRMGRIGWFCCIYSLIVSGLHPLKILRFRRGYSQRNNDITANLTIN